MYKRQLERKRQAAAELAQSGSGSGSGQGRWERETGLQLGGAFAEGAYELELRNAERTKVTVSESAEEIGSRVWDCAILMSQWFAHLAERDPTMFKGKRILELGSGTGLLGIVCAKLGAELVVLSDLPVLAKTMEANAARNGVDKACRVRCFNWNDKASVKALLDEFPSFDLIVASDVLVFAGDARKPFLHTTAPDAEFGLLATICACADPATTRILMGCGVNRQGFLDGFYKNPPIDLFEMERVPSDRMHPDFRTDRIVLYDMRVRKRLVV